MFKISLSVRDYECDLQGRVNNAVYLNYLEHARHTYLKELGLDFSQLVKQGLHLVATRLEIDYKKSLFSGDEIEISTSLYKVGKIRYIFEQSIHNGSQLVATAKVYAAVLDDKGVPLKRSLELIH